jgi:hypothetical protein
MEKHNKVNFSVVDASSSYLAVLRRYQQKSFFCKPDEDAITMPLATTINGL